MQARRCGDAPVGGAAAGIRTPERGFSDRGGFPEEGMRRKRRRGVEGAQARFWCKRVVQRVAMSGPGPGWACDRLSARYQPWTVTQHSFARVQQCRSPAAYFSSN